jgi:hypothetical protein
MPSRHNKQGASDGHTRGGIGWQPVDPAVAGALIGFGGTAAAALGTHFLSGRHERARQEHAAEDARAARREARIEELRGVMDQAAVALTSLMDAYTRAEHCLRHTSAEPADRHEEIYWDFVNALREAWRQHTRLNVRLGEEHEVSARYYDAVKPMMDQVAVVSGLRYSAPRERRVSGDEARVLIAATEAAFEAQQKFHDAASAAVGVDAA